MNISNKIAKKKLRKHKRSENKNKVEENPEGEPAKKRVKFDLN